jgi:PAS domain S-box-containing protein
MVLYQRNKEVAINYQTIFDRLPGAYAIFDINFYILAANGAFLHISLTKRDEIVGKNLFEVFPDNPDDKLADGEKNLRSSLNTVISTGQRDSMAIQKYDIRGKDGGFEVRYWSPINVPLFNGKGELTCILQRVEDVTEFTLLRIRQQEQDVIASELQNRLVEMETEVVQRSREIKKMNADLELIVEERTRSLLIREAELSIQNKKLSTQNKELEQFSYVASHDLQEPLRSLTSLTELLKVEYGAKLDEQANTYMDFIRQCSLRMQQLVGGLLKYARVGKENQRTHIDCNELIQQVLSDLSTLIQDVGAEIRVLPLPTIEAYPIELRSLFQNLISNALKFNKKDTHPIIKISAIPQGKDWRFEVEDNGIGIEEKHISKLFVIFKRLHNRNDYDGTGIGLALCKKIVDLHDGEIWVESIPGEGSNFIFTIAQ